MRGFRHRSSIIPLITYYLVTAWFLMRMSWIWSIPFFLFIWLWLWIIFLMTVKDWAPTWGSYKPRPFISTVLSFFILFLSFKWGVYRHRSFYWDDYLKTVDIHNVKEFHFPQRMNLAKTGKIWKQPNPFTLSLSLMSTQTESEMATCSEAKPPQHLATPDPLSSCSLRPSVADRGLHSAINLIAIKQSFCVSECGFIDKLI